MTLASTAAETWLSKTRTGPSWLDERRASAAALFAKSELPTEGNPNFKYGRIDALDLSRFSPFEADGTAADPERGGSAGSELLAEIAKSAAIVRTIDGGQIDIERPAGLLDGLSVSALSETELAPERFGELLGGVSEPFVQLAEASLRDAVVITVAPGIVIEEPIVILHALSSASASRIVAPRTYVDLGERAQLSVIELFTSEDDQLLCLPVAELHVGGGAHLSYHAVQQLGAGAWQLGYQLSRVARDGHLRSFSAALGGDYARLYTRSDLVGEGAESRLLATYLAKGDQVQDLRTFQEHSVGHTKSDLVFKGAVADHARSVYTGLIHIAKGARRANAAQTNRNLILSEGAHADSVPNLDIEENDVRCSHASAVGPIDAEQRFYLESRGLPTEVADRLILLGFFDDLFDSVPDPGCASYLREIFAPAIAEVRV